MRRKLIRKFKLFKEKLIKWGVPEIKKHLWGISQIDYKDIPIVINNYNRITTLLQLINGLESRGYRNIYIIDNKSTYPPLLEYYKNCPYTVYVKQERRTLIYMGNWHL